MREFASLRQNAINRHFANRTWRILLFIRRERQPKDFLLHMADGSVFFVDARLQSGKALAKRPFLRLSRSQFRTNRSRIDVPGSWRDASHFSKLFPCSLL